MAQSCELPAGISLFYYCRFAFYYYSSACFIDCKMATFRDAAVLSYIPAPGPSSCHLRTKPFFLDFHFILFFIWLLTQVAGDWKSGACTFRARHLVIFSTLQLFPSRPVNSAPSSLIGTWYNPFIRTRWRTAQGCQFSLLNIDKITVQPILGSFHSPKGNNLFYNGAERCVYNKYKYRAPFLIAFHSQFFYLV